MLIVLANYNFSQTSFCVFEYVNTEKNSHQTLVYTISEKYNQ